MNKVAIVIGVMALVLSITGSPLAGKKKKDKRAEKVQFSGFLDDYSGLERADDISDFVWGYTRRPLILRDYHAAIVDPVLVYFLPDSDASVALDPEKLAELTRFFRTSVIEELEQVRDFQVVEQPGPGVARVRLAVTDIDVSKSAANVGTKVTAMATVGAGFLVPALDVGGATMECEILDSESGERLMAVVDRDRGRRMFNFKSMKTLGDAKAAMRGWAKEFRAHLERIHRGELPEKLEKRRRENG